MGDYVIIEWNQASGRPQRVVGDIYDDEGQAIEQARAHLAENRSRGRREGFSVHEVGEVVWQDEDGQ